MWDGFWVHSFKRGTLIISCSFDRIYYRDFDLVFKKVTFFNVPDSWRDTDVHGDNLLRLAPEGEFTALDTGITTEGLGIFAIDLHLNIDNSPQPHTFFIVAEHIYLNKCLPEDCNPVPEYKDPIANEPYPCMKNRFIKK